MQRLAEIKVNELTIPELEAMAEDIALAECVVEAWKKRMKLIAEKEPGLLTRFGLSKESSTRSIPDLMAAFKALKSNNLLSSDDAAALDQFLGCCSVSRPELIQTVAAENFVTDQQAEEKVNAALGELVKTKPRARSLVEK